MGALQILYNELATIGTPFEHKILILQARCYLGRVIDVVFFLSSNPSETALPIAIFHMMYQTVCIVKEPSDDAEHVALSSHFECLYMF